MYEYIPLVVVVCSVERELEVPTLVSVCHSCTTVGNTLTQYLVLYIEHFGERHGRVRL
jgi:hypothetical protein